MPFNEGRSDEMIRGYTAEHPQRGERMICAMMLAKSNMTFTRQQIRESITRVDNEGLLRRRNLFDKKLKRYTM